MSPISAPADKRFRRAHIKPGRRRGKWRGLIRPAVTYGVLVLIALYGVYRGGGVLMHARLLQVDRLLVRGTERLSSGEVLAVLGGLRGENIIWADLSAWRLRLLSSPWVRDVTLRRLLPSTVEVVVSERQPIGIARLDGRLYLVDERGVLMDEYGSQYADFDLPIIDGLTPPAAGDEGGRTDAARAELAARLIASVGSRPEIARRLSQVDVSDLHNAAVMLSGDPAVLYVGEDRFLPRLQSYVDLAEALRERVQQIDYVDLRFGDRIYVRPVGAPRSALARR
jgi:cell division protein FtsQ